MFDNLSVEELVALLADAPAIDLKALKLMSEADVQPGQIFPRGLPRSEYLAAFAEWKGYVKRCGEVAQIIIRAIPMLTDQQPTEDYPL